jgi:general secretion pathway protein E
MTNPMISTTNSTPVTASLLDAALMAVRKELKGTSDLWTGLTQHLQIESDVLAKALLEFQGVASFSDADWGKVALIKQHGPFPNGADTTNSEHKTLLLEVELLGQTHLLCDDPWSADASRFLLHGPAMKLTLARPGQMEALQKSSSLTATPGSQNLTFVPNGKTLSSSVVKFVEDAIVHAYQEGASDIHFETSRAGIGVKYRLDGVMAPGPRFDDPARAEEIISRIKVMAQLDITERRRPQDGRIHWSHTHHGSIDLRVSIMPSIFGEDAVLRLLDKAQLRESHESISLQTLGFDGPIAATLRGLAGRPHGMLLITGPTGSGKTTTIYAALSEVNDGLEKIITIEDPVEYELPGVLQIPVNEQKGLTFATGLRSILRHDPDKILVGEIRDAETAQIAVQSSLTGHLVFTTVHANSLFDVLGRFHHFGIEPFAMASALNGIVVQRLLRKLCPHCVTWREATEEEHSKLEALRVQSPDKLPVANGCSHCRDTGYRGRFVVAEVHELSDALRDLIVHRSSMSELKNALYADHEMKLLNQALRHVTRGTTSIEEVIRVIGLV